MTFADQITAHCRRLGIARVARELGRTRRTLELWRAGQSPDPLTQRGALAVLESIPTPTKMKTEVTLTETQKASARKAGLTMAEAKQLVIEARRDERLDRESYRQMTRAEQLAHDNL
jgi:transposase-like protein